MAGSETARVGELMDISVPIAEGMVIWPTDPQVRLSPIVGEFGGRRITLTEIHVGTHTGTHVDAPLHIGASAGTAAQIPLTTLIGPAQVMDLRGTTEIGAEALAARCAGEAPRVLLRTDNSAWIRTGPARRRPAHLTDKGARWLVGRGVTLLGIDGLTVGTARWACT